MGGIYRQFPTASRLTVGALGFLTFTQYSDRPEPSRAKQLAVSSL
jgi:hypothetical protein